MDRRTISLWRRSERQFLEANIRGFEFQFFCPILKRTCSQECFPQRSELLLAINLIGRNCPSRFFFCKYSQLQMNVKHDHDHEHEDHIASRLQQPQLWVGALSQSHPGLWVPAMTPTVHQGLYGGRPWVARKTSHATRQHKTKSQRRDQGYRGTPL